MSMPGIPILIFLIISKELSSVLATWCERCDRLYSVHVYTQHILNIEQAGDLMSLTRTEQRAVLVVTKKSNQDFYQEIQRLPLTGGCNHWTNWIFL